MSFLIADISAAFNSPLTASNTNGAGAKRPETATPTDFAVGSSKGPMTQAYTTAIAHPVDL